jgi:hypothetical protein
MRLTEAPPSLAGLSVDHLQPRLITGETKQAFLSSKFKVGRSVSRPLPKRMNALRLKNILRYCFPTISLNILHANP